jgi:hypothetical protein
MIADSLLPLSMIFNVTLFASVGTFPYAAYAFGGFDIREILRIIRGEKKARYSFIVLFLFIGISISIAFYLV